LKDLRPEEDGRLIDDDVNLVPDHTDEPFPTVFVTRPTFRPVQEPGTPRADIDELCGKPEEISSNSDNNSNNNRLPFRKISSRNHLQV
jgi:hypothetical protein